MFRLFFRLITLDYTPTQLLRHVGVENLSVGVQQSTCQLYSLFRWVFRTKSISPCAFPCWELFELTALVPFTLSTFPITCAWKFLGRNGRRAGHRGRGKCVIPQTNPVPTKIEERWTHVNRVTEDALRGWKCQFVHFGFLVVAILYLFLVSFC